MINGLGLIKNAPQKGAERKTRSCIAKTKKSSPLANAQCEKFIDFWNDLSFEYHLPVAVKVRGGKVTKSYKMALQFFAALKNGTLIHGNRMFRFSAAYLANENIKQLSNDGYRDSDIFYMIKVVASHYVESYAPSTFSQLLYNTYGATAKRYGGGVSRFLEILSDEMEDDRLGRELELEINEYLTDEEYRILRDVLCNLYHQIRKDGGRLEEIPDFELANLLSGMKYLKTIYLTYKPRLEKSYAIQSRDIKPTFFWFVDTFADLVEIPNWRDMPMAVLFNRRKQYLGTFLDKLEAML